MNILKETSHVGVEPTTSGLEVQRSSTKLMTLDFLVNMSSKANFTIPSWVVPPVLTKRELLTMGFRSSWRRPQGW
jgi:ribosomal protein L39E